MDVPRGVGGGAGDGGQVRPREHRNHRRGEGRVREIVEVPADPLPASLLGSATNGISFTKTPGRFAKRRGSAG